jgi:hypothetical protein
MVDALGEIARVLATDGVLVDLRPVSSQCPLDFVTPEKTVRFGMADGTGMAADDSAADRAIEDAVERGWFVPRRRVQFDFDFYWDSAFREQKLREEGSGTRIRCRRATMLATYRKARPAPD